MRRSPHDLAEVDNHHTQSRIRFTHARRILVQRGVIAILNRLDHDLNQPVHGRDGLIQIQTDGIVKADAQGGSNREFEHFRLHYMHLQVAGKTASVLDPQILNQTVIPLAQSTFGLIEEKLSEAHKGGKLAPGLNPRQLGVSARHATIGLITMVGATQDANEPMPHSTQSLIDQMCLTFRYAAGG